MSYTVRILVAALALALASGPVQAQKAGKAKAAKAKAGKAKAAKAKPIKVNVATERTALFGADQGAAKAAAERLGRTKQPGAFDALADALAMGLPPAVAAVALDALANHGDPRAFDVIDHYTHYRNPNVRAAAVRAMGALEDKRAVGRVVWALSDGHQAVRAAAAGVIAERQLKLAIEPLLALLKKGDEAAADALAAVANPDLAREVGELIGQAPNGLLARCLGAILLRPDFKPESARVEVVRALGKIPGNESLEQLTTYVASVPEMPPRQSRREAEALVEARLSGD